MALIKWSPFMFEPFEDFDKVFGNSIIPPIDMYETKEAVVVETPLAGVDPNKVEVSLENGMLTIKGSSERKTEVEEKDYYRHEIRSGSVFRRIAVPKHIKEDKIEAAFDNGVLKITMPKTDEKTKTFKVAVKKK